MQFFDYQEESERLDLELLEIEENLSLAKRRKRNQLASDRAFQQQFLLEHPEASDLLQRCQAAYARGEASVYDS